MDVQEPPAPKVGAMFAVVTVLIGIVILVVSRLVSWPDGESIGYIILGIGIPYLLWMVYQNLARLKIISLILLMRKEKLVEISKGKVKNRNLIAGRFKHWADKKEDSDLKVKGVTLNLFFGNTGLLQEMLLGNKINNRGGKTIKALLLNPYSMSAITRSIQESRPFIGDKPDPVDAICEQTLAKHKSDILYKDFCVTVANIRDLQRNVDTHRLKIECHIYSTFSPSFLLIDDQIAVSENLILGRKKNEPAGKLYGLLPHMVYQNGDIKECMENHFDYIWQYDSVSTDDFCESVEEKNYEINRLFLLYNVQKDIWDREYDPSSPARSLNSVFDMLYQVYKEELFPGVMPRRILDLGCGDGGGGSLKILADFPDARINFNDISQNAIHLFKQNVKANNLDSSNAEWYTGDMLTYLNNCRPNWYSLVYANFAIIYMTKIKAIEIFRQIFITLQSGGIFMLSVWTENYFNMPIGEHGTPGHRPAYRFERIPMTENLQVLVEGPKNRLGEIRRFYRDFDELMEEFESADDQHQMEFETIVYRYYENDAVLRVWLKKK